MMMQKDPSSSQLPNQLFSLRFAGDSYVQNSMNADELAPTLTSLVELLNSAYAVQEQATKELSVKVQAFEAGSFEILLSVSPQDILALFQNENILAVKNMLECLILGSSLIKVTLFDLIKRTKGQKPKKVKKTANGDLNLVFDDNNGNITVSPTVYNIYVDKEVRDNLENFTKTLPTKGVASISFLNSSKEPVTDIEPSDYSSFKTPDDVDIAEEILIDRTETMFIQPINLSFSEGNKWRFSSGNEKSTFYATIIDEQFLDQIQKSHIAIRKGDLFKVEMRIMQINGANGLKETREVVRIIDHKKASSQLSLKIED